MVRILKDKNREKTESKSFIKLQEIPDLRKKQTQQFSLQHRFIKATEKIFTSQQNCL